MLFDKDGHRFLDYIFGSEISRLQLPEFDQNPNQDSFRLDEDVFFTYPCITQPETNWMA